MDSKIRELTDKIYNEGVQRGNKEADRIIKEAQAEAKKIVDEAEQTADKIRTKSQKDNEELRNKTEMELKLYANQLVESVKTSIATVVSDTIVKEQVAKVVSDSTFMQQLILDFTKHFNLEKGLVISTSQQKELVAFFQKQAKDLLDKGVEIKEVGGYPTEFTVSPKDGAYKIQFGKEQFEELFKSFLRPQMAKTLFDK